MTEDVLPPHLETLAILLACTSAESVRACAAGVVLEGAKLVPWEAAHAWKRLTPDMRQAFRGSALLVSRFVHMAAQVDEVPLASVTRQGVVFTRGGNA